MGIGGVTSTNSMSVMQMTTTNITDTKSKSIQKELTDVQQQMQKLSSDEELSVNEKTDEQKKLQKEKSDLTTELKQHQEELSRSQKREIMLSQLQEAQSAPKEEASDGKIQPEEETSEDKLPAREAVSDQEDETKLPINAQQTDQTGQPGTVITQNSDGTVILKGTLTQEENAGADTAKESSMESDETEKAVTTAEETKVSEEEDDRAEDTGFSNREVHAMVSADVSEKQADRLGTVVAKTNDGIAILKSEIKQDERRGVDTEKKQAELEKLEQQEARAEVFQFSVLGGANNAMKAALETNAPDTKDGTGNVENNAYANAMNISQEEQAQRQFYVSIA